MRTSILFSTTILIFLIFGCTTHSNKEIRMVIGNFYKNHKGDFRTVDKTLLTQDLSSLIDKAIAREMCEAENMIKSDFPSDKPLMIEGDIFTSLYEGHDSYKIRGIKMNGNKATAIVEFSNTSYPEPWNDEVLLVKEKGWKIDNVIFKAQMVDMESTKEVLLELINNNN
jgi:hypothetical protein